MQIIFKVELFDLSSCGSVRPKPEEQINITIDGFLVTLDLLEGLGKTALFLVDEKMLKHCNAIIQRAQTNGCIVEVVKGHKITSLKYLWWHKLPLDLYTIVYKLGLAKLPVPVWIMTDCIFNKPYKLPTIVNDLAATKIIKRVARILVSR